MIRLTDELLAHQAGLDESTLSPRAAVVRLPVRDADHARRRAALIDALCGILAGLAVVALAAWCAGLIGGRGNVWDRQPMGEGRTPSQEVRERG